MSNDKVYKFLSKVKQINKSFDPSKYVPEYNEGDVIVNDKFKVISKVKAIAWKQAELRDKLTGRPSGYREQVATPHYILVDYENKAAEKAFKESGRFLDKKTRQRWKQCSRIDSTYKLLDPMKAKILFGESDVKI